MKSNSACLRTVVSGLVGGLIGLTLGTFAFGADLQSKHQFSIPAQSLDTALLAFSDQASVQVLMRGGAKADARSSGVTGQLVSLDALKAILKDTGYGFQQIDNETVAIVAPDVGTRDTVPRPGSPESQGTDIVELEEVVVTGSHIRGAPTASAVITITDEQMREAGQYTLGDVVRSVPQNFAGGQNPGVSLGAASGNIANQNITNGSSLNLRGLGPDATLTLLNGRRVAYDGFTQGIDLSVIPVAALDRVEIVADGASAVYGSDAVGGVANIILKPDYQGITTSARAGTSTSGGDFQEQYTVVGGDRWSGGGLIGTFDFERDTAIYSSQRDFTSLLLNPNILLAPQKTYALVFSAHQDLGEGATVSIDSLYNSRKFQYPQTLFPGDVTGANSEGKNYEVSPTLTLHLPAQWRLEINGVYGRNEAFSNNYSYSPAGQIIPGNNLCECNGIAQAEMDADGALLALPAGEVRVALGEGYRQNTYVEAFYSAPDRTVGRRDSYYGFGEVAVPLAAPTQEIRGLYRLSITGALRYEHYNDMGGVSTPKLGLVYAPTTAVDLKGSWGRSFKAPTLAQQDSRTLAYLEPAYSFGATGVPSTAQALLAYGGNPALGPEHATTWTATLAVHPAKLAALNAELGYFNVSYTDRVLQPVANLDAAFSDPVYRQFLNLNPSLAAQQQVIAAAGGVSQIQNASGAPYDPATVIGIINDYYTNIAIQSIHGADLSASYRFDLQSGTLTLSDAASWLISRQQNSALQPVFDLAGTEFNPPHWRSRLGISWKSGALVLSAFANYLGGVTNTLVVPSVHGGSMTTVDFAGLYKLSSDSYLTRDVDLALSVQNIGNVRPPYLKNLASFEVYYDSTNYSAIGRFISLSIAKHW